jgi:protein-tyrosine phosphatase
VLDNQRILRLGGVRNLRDVGGYPTRDSRRTRWRTLYRSDCLDKLDPAGQAWLIDAGLRSVVDIRGDDEVAERPNVFAASKEVKYRPFPLFEGPPPDDLQPDLHNGYRREVDLLGRRLAELLEALLEADTLPTVVHCAAGKDRTGIVIAVILAAVGTEPGVIAEDYAMSQACLGATYLDDARAWATQRGLDWSIWEHTAHTPPERMLKTLAYVNERDASVDRYLLEHGLSPSALANLREVLTEPA